MASVLEGGPWYFGGRPIFLQTWKPNMNLSKAGCKRIPIWVHFHNVPLEFWTDEGLSHIASLVGRPLLADKMTSELKRLSYARICIEIGIEDSLPNAFDLELDDGTSLEILIEYNWVPKKCLICKEFGHLSKNCKKVKHQDWVPKVQAKSAPIPSKDGEWQQVKRHGKEVIVDTSPPCNIPVKEASNAAICSTSNAFEVLPLVDDKEEVEGNLILAPSLEDTGQPLDIAKEPFLDDNSALPFLIEEGPHLQRSTLCVTIGKEENVALQRNDSTPFSDCSSVSLHNPLIQKITMVDEFDKRHKKTLKRRESRKKKEGSLGTPGSHSSSSL